MLLAEPAKLIALASDTNLMLNLLIYPFYFAQVPKNKEELAALQARLRKRFPVDAYNKARKELDPHGILSNNKLDKLFPMAETVWEASCIGLWFVYSLCYKLSASFHIFFF